MDGKSARKLRSSYAWRKMSQKILAENKICHLCGKPGADTVDHVQPLASQGGEMGALDRRNLLPAHRSCNSQRGNRPPKPRTNPSREW